MAHCDHCGRSFARNEHLIRHLRTHTGERPFSCPHCTASFHRADVRAKHVRKVHPEKRAPSESSGLVPRVRDERARPGGRERSRLACDQCRKRKLKCDNARPCESCRSKNLSCTVSSTSRPPGRPRNPPRFILENRRARRDDEGDLGVSPVPQFWTPNSLSSPLEPPGLLSPMTAVGISGIVESSESCPTGSAYTSTAAQPWMTSEPASGFSIQPPFSSGSMPIIQIDGDTDFMDNLLPQFDTGSWLDDLNEFALPDYSWPSNPPTPAADPDPLMDEAVYLMKEHLHRRTRDPSPSRDEQKRSWYSSPPRLGIYDKDVLNVLLNLARTHISSTFAIFSNFQADGDTRVELCLVMCSVGGLYCTAYAGVKFAKMLFNDARRLLLERYLLEENAPSFDEALSFAKTFVLLEIYGLCSGDKRAYEFIEVFHGSKLDAVSSCLKALPGDASAAQRQQVKLLVEATRVLDSYRVLLLQRPPSFMGGVSLGSEVQESKSTRATGMASTHAGEGPLGAPATEMDHLAATISYSWMASPQHNENSSSPTLWKQDFVELALGRWIQAKAEHSDTPGLLEAPQMLLYHLTKVSLHSNLSYLQRLSPEALQAAASPQIRDVPDPIREWVSSRHFKIAQWHAQAILRVAREVMAPPGRFASPGKGMIHGVEAPHMPLCIYFATLVVWCGEMASGDLEAGLVRPSALDAGSQLLFRLRVPVSKLLGTVLRDLLSSDS